MRPITCLSICLNGQNLNQKGFSIKPKNINLSAGIDQSSKALLETVRQKEITLSINVQDHHVIYSDKNMLMTLLRNLLTNAIKFAEKGGLISISSSYEGRDKVQLMISDTRIGIDQKKLEGLLNDKTSRKQERRRQ
jgi:signal transduction histidine kinase